MHGNNEIANILPLQEVAEICIENNAVFHSDTVQTMGHYTMDLRELMVHFVASHLFRLRSERSHKFVP